METVKKFIAKLPLYFRIIWGTIVLFAFAGFLVGKTSDATVLAVLVCVCWVINRIVAETFEAFQVLAFLKREASSEDPDSSES